MGMYALIEDVREQELASAVEAANEWQKVGRPIILASLHLLTAAEDALWELRGSQSRTFREAFRYAETAAEELREMLDGIRDDFISDQSKSWSSDLSDEEGENVDVFNDALSDAVVSVGDLEKLVEREDYDAFVRGGR